MPVEQGSTFQPVRALLVAVIGIAMAVGCMFLLLSLADSGSEVIDLRLGDDAFRAGDPHNQSTAIDRDGPILYADLVGKGRHIYVQHLGEDPLTGWLAFDAQRPGQPENCVLEWTPERRAFVDPCEPSVSVFEDGGDLPSYPVRIDDDLLWVDLNASQR